MTPQERKTETCDMIIKVTRNTAQLQHQTEYVTLSSLLKLQVTTMIVLESKKDTKIIKFKESLRSGDNKLANKGSAYNNV